MGLKKYKQYLNEASLEDNTGVPKRFLRDVKDSGVNAANNFKRNHFSELVNMMPNSMEMRRLQSGFEQELEALAEETIREAYGSILDGVDLIIKFAKPQEIQRMMDDTPPDEDEYILKNLEDQSTIDEINKRKILKNIMQGEAKNSKSMLNLPEVREKIVALMGDRDGNRYLELLNRVITAAGHADWDMPLEIQKDLWQREKNFAGAVKVSWEKNDDEESSEESAEESVEEVAQRILDELQEGGDIPEEAEDLFDSITPTIHAIGHDFAMLLHETIKGIYNLIISASIPSNQEQAETVIMNTDTLADELEDLRYGPVFAAKLRDFLNEFPESDQIENLREHVVGKLSVMPAEEFLSLMLLFLNNDPIAKSKFQKIINEIKKDFSDYEIDARNQARDQDVEPNEWEENISSNSDDTQIASDSSKPSDQDLKSMSDKEIMDLMDIAIDNADKDEYQRLAKYLKESRNYEFN